MDLTQVVNTDINFSKATMEDILQRYGVKSKNSASTSNKTPQTVRTAISSLRQAYARVHGDKPDEYGDLTWLTLENLKKPGKFATARPLFEGAAFPGASETMSIVLEPETVRKNLVAFRAALYAAAAHLDTIEMPDTDRDKLKEQYKKAYDEFGKIQYELFEAEIARQATHEPSKRQLSKWVAWPDLRKMSNTVAKSLEATFRTPPASMSVTDNKQLQRKMQFCMYTLIPPVRGGDYAGLRFIAPQEENEENLRITGSPNYVLVKDDGSMELVFNQYKSDKRAVADDYDPTTFKINHPYTKRFPLEDEPTLNKYGFDPKKLGTLLQGYWSLQQALLGEQNTADYVFFEIKRGESQLAQKATGEMLTTRMARITERLTGQTLGATMFRTIFSSWFASKKPKMGDRQPLADWMMHNLQTQLETYVKGSFQAPKRPAAQDGEGRKRPRVTLKNLRI